MSKKKPTGKPVGRPRLNLPTKPRRFLQVERNPEFDSDLANAMKCLAGMRGLSENAISQSEAVRRALRLFAASFDLTPNGTMICPRCNGIGHLGIRNGDDDTPCPECSSEENEL